MFPRGVAIVLIVFLVAAAWLAYSNGANDNFKGVATLWGSRTVSYRNAVLLAAGATLAGSMTAATLGDALVQAFSGKGLVPAATLADPAFLLATAAGAAGTVFVATRFGLPVSTTHAIIGALVGAGLTTPGGIDASRLMGHYMMPLLLTPAAALTITWALYTALNRIRLAMGVKRDTCVCIGDEVVACVPERVAADTLAFHPDARLAATGLRLQVAPQAVCISRYRGRVIGIDAESLLKASHILSAVGVSFARGLQDTAKIAGIVVGGTILGFAPGAHMSAIVFAVGAFIALGGTSGGRRVATTMGRDITDMNAGQGFTANLVTSGLVIGAAVFGLPVSTTHCSVGALFGVGIARRSIRWRVLRSIVLAWIITLPLGAALSAGALYLST